MFRMKSLYIFFELASYLKPCAYNSSVEETVFIKVKTMDNIMLVRVCALLLCISNSHQDDFTPYYHEIDIHPGLVFVQAKEIVFIKEKWSVARSVNTEFVKFITKLGRADLELIRNAYVLLRKPNSTIVHMVSMVDIELRSLAEVINNLRKTAANCFSRMLSQRELIKYI